MTACLSHSCLCSCCLLPVANLLCLPASCSLSLIALPRLCTLTISANLNFSRYISLDMPLYMDLLTVLVWMSSPFHCPMNFTYVSFNEILMLHFMRFYLMKYLQCKASCLQYRPYHPVMTTWTPCSLNSGHAPSHSQSNKHVERTLILDLDFGSSCAINVLFQSLCTICCFWSF